MKGMALNRAIYVFTAVTIIYTPLGFMTVGKCIPKFITRLPLYYVQQFFIIATMLKRGFAGTLGFAYFEHQPGRRQCSPVYTCFYSDVCQHPDSDIPCLSLHGLVLYIFRSNLAVFRKVLP